MGPVLTESVSDEILVVESVLCGVGEFQRVAEDCIRIQLVDRVWLTLGFHQNYPSMPPNISVSATAEGFSRKECEEMTSFAKDCAADLSEKGDVYTLQLVELLRSKLDQLTGSSNTLAHDNTNSSNSVLSPNCETCNGDDATTTEILIVKIDHMRHPARYQRTLCGWSAELCLQIDLILARDRGIHLVAVGHRPDISQFLVRWKSQNVDIDSRGRPCKEKMMSVLVRERWQLASPRLQGKGELTVLEVDCLVEKLKMLGVSGQLLKDI